MYRQQLSEIVIPTRIDNPDQSSTSEAAASQNSSSPTPGQTETIIETVTEPTTSAVLPETTQPEISQPEPVLAEVSQPEPVLAEVSQPEPVLAEVSQPEPVLAEVSQPEPVLAEVNQPQSVVSEPIRLNQTEEPVQQSVSESSVEKIEVEVKLQPQVAALQAMGFTDIRANLKALRKHSGSLAQAIDELLN